MKLIINNWPEESGQELPGDTKVEYFNDAGDRFRISPSESGQGLSISFDRKASFTKVGIYPKFSNNIEIE